MKQQTTLKSWVDVYHIFMGVADEILDQCDNHDLAHQLIQTKVEEIYFPHQGEYIWDFAYERWTEPSDDDEEV